MLEPPRVLLLRWDMDADTVGSWLWYLDEVEATTTRLIVRFRADYSPSLWGELLIRGLMEPGSFVMEQKTMRGIRQRAEAAAAQQVDHAVESLLSES